MEKAISTEPFARNPHQRISAGSLIHEIFEAQVRRSPQATAVLHADRSLTYIELDSRANQLARYLVSHGVGPDQLVAVCLERSIEMVVGVLAALKAGGAYLPLDPNYPSERLRYMLEDAAPQVVLTEVSLRAALPQTDAEIIAISPTLESIEDLSTEVLQARGSNAGENNLVYVIYTSGSTGRPKGTEMPHRSVVNLIEWHRGNVHLCLPRRVLQFAALSFDVAFQEIFSTLCTGGTLVMLDEWVRRDPQALAQFLGREAIERLFVPPMVLQALAEHCVRLGTAPADLKDVIAAGERLRVSPQVKAFFQQIPGCRLHNHYGPTETHVVTALTLDGDPRQWPNLPNIGRPLSNVDIHLLDDRLQPVPPGGEGEIFISGAALARGYLGRPEMTAQRFIDASLPGQPHQRLYKTGDLGHWRPDGTLDYLGRNDDQVKIRGFRIELGEIEAQLARHHCVRDAAVIAREDTPDEKRLVAYVTLHDSQRAVAEELRIHLEAVLPDYMVPSAFVVLDRFPLSPNGKLDRRALPAPDWTAYTIRPFEAPQGQAEEALAALWRDLLSVPRVGRRDSFFELGGHSLMIVRLMERLHRAGWTAEGHQLFKKPILADFAAILSRATQSPEEIPPNTIPPGCEALTPQMLPLIDLTHEHLEHIAQSVAGGSANIQDIYPLAPLQEGILFHHLLSGSGGDTYVLPTLLSFSSQRRLEQFIAALRAVIARHDILRTAVLWERLPKPVQVVYREVTLPIEELTLDADREALLQMQERMRPECLRLPITRAPMMQLQIARAEQNDGWYALLKMHHLVGDHESIDTILAEVASHLEGRAHSLPAPMPYRSHVAQSLARAGRDDAEAYFRAKLSDIDEPTAPFGLLDVHGDGRRIEEARESLDGALSKAIRLQARRLGVSAATLFHAAWAVVVSRTSAREDVVFGSLLLGRLQGRAGGERTLGMFINTLPLRLSLDGLTAEQLINQTKQELIELLAHEQASLAVAQRCSRVATGMPLFTSLLNYRHSQPSAGARTLSRGIDVLADQEWTNYPLILCVDDFGEDFGLVAQTDRRIEPQRITAYVIEAMRSLLTALSKAPQTPALSLSILPPSERRQLLEIFNSTRTARRPGALIHNLIEEQTDHTPDALAVVFEAHCLTYEKLDARANQLAHYLIDQGVRPDQRVGVCAERSLEMVIALLAVLKAGAAYVPLDPGYPPDRLQYMLTDAGPRVLLTQQHLRARLPVTEASVLAIDEAWSSIAQYPRHRPDSTKVGLRDHHLAYVIYTSGSTGKPKGAMNEHRGVVNRLQWMQDQYHLRGEDRVLQKTPFSFDVSVWEFFWTLMSGAQLVVARPEGHKDPMYLRQLIETRGVTRLHFVPSMLQTFLDQIQPGQCPSLGHVVCSGEELPATLQRKCFEILPHVGLSNLYGPTEAAVDVTAWECNPGDSSPRVPIGRPIANIEIHVLDKHGSLAPLGVAGEIHIAGVGVGRGYLNRPELTAERFVRNPFSTDHRARMYRTGDLGRWRSDGALEYLGRNDSQVKIRGFRIELGEIEAQLAQHPGVKEAAVLAREDVSGEKRLVAYVTVKHAASLQAPNAESLRCHLRSALPDHMVPSAYVVLEHLPLSPNGKLDRKALPAPEHGAYVNHHYEPPQGEVEEILAGIWQSLLRLESVGRRDNFFELGGHSLLMVQLLDRLRRVGLSAPLRTVFESPTLADLAIALKDTEATATPVPANLIPPGCDAITSDMLTLVELDPEHIATIVAMVPGGAANIQDIYPLAPLQEGILFHHLVDGHRGDTYIVSTLLSVSSRDRLEELITALQAVIDRHDILRTAVLWEQLPRAVQVVFRHAVLPVEVLPPVSDEDPLEQLKERMRPQHQRLDLRHAPLLRLLVSADPNSTRCYVVLQVHHMTCDHETVAAIVTEVVDRLEGKALPSEAVPYRNHVAQALAYARDHNAESFFRSKLGDIQEPTAPFGLLDVHGDGGQVEEASEKLDPQLAQRVRLAARRAGVSAATLFHAAWGLVVARTSGLDDIVFGTVLLGRLQGSAGAQRTLGMFINTLPLRLSLADLTVAELLEHTQRELIALLGHEQASLAVAQRSSGLNGSGPLFTVLLNYRHSGPNGSRQWSDAQGIQPLLDQERTNYPVVMSVDDLGEEFLLTAQSDTRIAPHRLTAYLTIATQSLLAALEGAPRTPALSLSLLPESERHQVVAQFNATDTAYPKEKLIQHVFEEQVTRSPQAIAVIGEGESLTYTQLNARANRVALHLLQNQVAAGEYVAVLMSRSLEMVIAQLAVLKCGAVYVPVDPELPLERLSFIVKDCRARTILTNQAPRTVFGDLRWIDYALAAATEDRPYANPRLNLATPAPAYVMYTSGSTGMPKGVVVPHHAVNRLALNNGYATLQPTDCLVHCSNPAFDASTFEIWGALLNGARVVVIPQSVVLDAKQFAAALVHHEVSVLWITVGLFVQYIDALAEVFPRLRYLITGGDVVDPVAIRKLLEQGPPQKLLNAYGPTECTTFSTTYVMNGLPKEARAIPIGRPIANTTVFILSRQRQPVPIGVAGEIYIGGDGLALGYLNQPELTAERFVPNPFDGGRTQLYRTGDLGRWRADGNLDYLGRNDSQVKIRGFRIEPGEIEATLLRHPQIKEAVVVARQDAPGEKRLVAYVTSRPPTATSTALDLNALRQHLAETLPDYMVPSAIVVLEALPLTVNGKIDRRALPAPERGAYVSRQYEPPQGEVEEILCGIWQRLLRLERVGRSDHFFELGGHSLLAVQLMEQLRRRGLKADVRDVFTKPRLAELAATIGPDSQLSTDVPPNRIPPGCDLITPDMLPLVQLSADHLKHIAAAVPGGMANIQDIYPLAPLQEGILFHYLLKGSAGGDSYVLPMLMSLPSPQQLSQFCQALQQVIARHDVLRTAVLWDGLPQPVQVVHRCAQLPVEVLDWQPGHDPVERLKQRMQPRAQRLDLRQAPMLRLLTLASPEGECYALLQLHHLIGDHGSMEIVLAEVTAHLQGTAHILPPPLPYRNHVAQALEYAAKNTAASFFREKLQDVDEPTAPFGLLDTHGDGSQVQDAREVLDPSLAQRIRVQSRRLGVSAATLFHAAWALVVSRTSGRDDIVYGTVLLGRLQGSAGAQRILGMFINTLPLRLQLRDTTAIGLIEQTQRELVGLLQNEQASLAIAQRSSGVSGSTPLFSALLNYRHGVLDSSEDWARAAGIRILSEQERTNYPVVLSVDDLGEAFALLAQTDHRIDPQRMTGYVREALYALVEALEKTPQIRVLSLSILPEAERRLVLHDFNATAMSYPRGKLVHGLFEEQAERTPNAEAVVFADKSLTYAELNGRANQLARHLEAKGIGPDRRVGICMERSLEMVIGLLGILKAGGAYVPLDPGYPPDRLRFMIDDTAPSVLLTQQHLLVRLPHTTAEVIPVDSHWSDIASRPVHNIDPTASGLGEHHLAYIIYTSGSTGQPKGAMNEHRGVVNRLQWMQDRYKLGPPDRILQKTPFSFDVSVWEFFWTLMSGARLVVARPEGHKDPTYLKRLIRTSGVTRLHFVPSMLQSFLEHASAGDCPSLRQIVCSGEELSAALRQKCFDRLPEVRLSNLYGPTEAAVDVTAWECSPQDQGARVPIGRPIANIRLYVLDEYANPAPFGVTGELYIAGIGVGRGYLNRPELTAERFLRDPFSPDPEARMYRTGDLGRWRPDGSLEYLGRNDHQVKIRGFRIELGEIEAEISRHPLVKEAVVIARDDAAGEKRLVAYVTPAALDPEALRTHLTPRLPDYMVPSAFVLLDSLPLSPNGKLDRKALPAPEDGAYAVRQYEAPRGETEMTLGDLWQSLLRVRRVGRHDDFFALGGHSLLATQLMVRIHSALSVEMPLNEIFEFPSLSAQAQRIDELRQESLLRRLAEGGDEVQELLETLSAMPESRVQELMRTLSTGDR